MSTRKSITVIFLGVLALLLTAIVSKINWNHRQDISVITFEKNPVANSIESHFKSTLYGLNDKDSIHLKIFRVNKELKNMSSITEKVIRNKPDIIVTISTPITQEVIKKIDNKQKLVYTFVTDLKKLGDDLERTNNTGVSDIVDYHKNIEMLKEIYGESFTIGMLYNPDEANSISGIEQINSIVKKSNIQLIKKPINHKIDINNATAELASSVDVIYIGGDNTVTAHLPEILKIANNKRVNVFASDSESVKAGAIAGVSVNYFQVGEETAKIVKKILEGEEPRSIPRVILGGNWLVINKMSAQKFKLDIPEKITENANEVIDF